jgi:hypothetical protein
MVFYYDDMNIPNYMSDHLVFILLFSIILLPYFIYYKKYDIALFVSLFVAIVQLFAIYKNIKRYPL